jgi:hypothetical protein
MNSTDLLSVRERRHEAAENKQIRANQTELIREVLKRDKHRDDLSEFRVKHMSDKQLKFQGLKSVEV